MPDKRARGLLINTNATAGQTGFQPSGLSPEYLFNLGLTGFWGDTTDSATLFEDATGTMPAVLSGMVGFRLDKSKGLALGPDEFAGYAAPSISDGGGSAGAWDDATNTLSNTVAGTSASNPRFSWAMASKPYWRKITHRFTGDTGQIFSTGSSVGSLGLIYRRSDGVDFSQELSFYVPPNSAGVLQVFTDGTSTFSIQMECTVEEIAGNHQYQRTSAQKPTLQTVGGVQALVSDDDDDSMLIDVPPGGWSGTFVQGTALGVIVGEIDVPAGPYQIPTDPNYAGPASDIHTVIVNASLPEGQANGLAEWVGQRCPVADFSTTPAIDSWFRNRDDLTALGFSRADGGNLVDLAGLALNASNLTRLTLGGLITATAADLGNMIRGTMLATLDLSDSVTSGVTDCTNFARGAPLETLTLDGGSGSPFSDSPCVNYSGAFIGTNLSQQSYTDLVTAIEAAGTSNGILDITGGTSTTTGAAQTAVDALRGRGWTVTTPDGY